MKIEWIANAFIAICVSTLMCAGYWVVMGKPAGGVLWLFWVLSSLVTSTIIDICKDKP